MIEMQEEPEKLPESAFICTIWVEEKVLRQTCVCFGLT